MEALLMAVMGITNLACFIIGAKVGQKVTKGEPIELPTLNPVKAYREHQAQRAVDAEQSKIDTIMQNIESYNGTSSGQKDIPR